MPGPEWPPAVGRGCRLSLHGLLRASGWSLNYVVVNDRVRRHSIDLAIVVAASYTIAKVTTFTTVTVSTMVTIV